MSVWALRGVSPDRVWQGVASGLLAVSISQLHSNWLMWFRPELVRSRDNLMENVGTRSEQVVDARSAGRFTGTTFGEMKGSGWVSDRYLD